MQNVEELHLNHKNGPTHLTKLVWLLLHRHRWVQPHRHLQAEDDKVAYNNLPSINLVPWIYQIPDIQVHRLWISEDLGIVKAAGTL